MCLVTCLMFPYPSYSWVFSRLCHDHIQSNIQLWSNLWIFYFVHLEKLKRHLLSFCALVELMCFSNMGKFPWVIILPGKLACDFFTIAEWMSIVYYAAHFFSRSPFRSECHQLSHCLLLLYLIIFWFNCLYLAGKKEIVNGIEGTYSYLSLAGYMLCHFTLVTLITLLHDWS